MTTAKKKSTARSRPRPVPQDPNVNKGQEKADEDPFYCPGCGRRHKFMTECRGMSATAPHPPILVVSTDELDGDPADHTPAPPGGE